MFPRFLLHSSLFFALISTSIWVAAHTDPKINEFSDYDCNTPTYSHAPVVDECVGIDPSTQSVYIVQGIGDSLAVGYNLTSGANSCSSVLNGGIGSCSAQIAFEPSAGPCYNLFRESEDNMVHDIAFSSHDFGLDSCAPQAEAPSG